MNSKKKKTYKFQSEIKELLNLMIHSLYSNKEIFLRELISNASDAIDKLRFLSVSSPNNFFFPKEYKIYISVDKNKKTLSIEDNGIGMSKEEIIENLGTIAKSGTKKFVQSFTNKNSLPKEKENELIGKFGVGFYSAFIVSKKVCVYSKSAKKNNSIGIKWESKGKGRYKISEKKKNKTGTKIVLFIKKSEENFLDIWTIEKIIKKYSNHISIPIEMKSYEKTEKKPVFKKINKADCIWVKNKQQITKKEYCDFYKNIANDNENPITWSHNKVEGKIEYISLLYIPKKSYWNLWDRENQHGLKLYIKKVFIMDKAQQFLPNYLRFVKGVIDSNDLPLNISREILQDHISSKLIKSTLTKRVLRILQNLAEKKENQYNDFWKEFGTILKEGPAEDPSHIATITNLLRFTSINTYNNKNKSLTSLQSYMNEMKKNQEKIYFITAENYSTAFNSPHLEIFKKNKIDVLLLTDKIDEWMISNIKEFQGKKFQSVSKTDRSIEKIIKKLKKENNPSKEKKIQDLIEKIKIILGKKVKDVRSTSKLINTPSVVVTDQAEISTQMAQLFASTGQPVPNVQYIFEINPNHKIIKFIKKIKEQENLKKWINLLFDQSLLTEKGTLENPNKFIQNMNSLLVK